MPEGEGDQELPSAGTPEMDALIQQINQQPAMLQQIAQNYPELLDEIMKHIGAANEQGQQGAGGKAPIPEDEEAASDYAADEAEVEEEPEAA